MPAVFYRSPRLIKLTQSGFTLIELLIATALSVLMIIVVSTMFFVTTTNSAKIEAYKVIKDDGESIKRVFNYLIKNSIKLLPNNLGESCTETASVLDSLKLKELDGGEVELKLVDTGSAVFIASNSTYLNSDQITPSNLQFSCIRNKNGETYVHYQFDLKLGGLASQHFSSFVLLRNN